MKEKLITWGINAFVVVMAAMPVVGISMWFYTGVNEWLYLCIPILIFLS